MKKESGKKIDIQPKDYWKSLSSRNSGPAENAEVNSIRSASEADNAWSRRNFLTLMGASMAMAGLTSCRAPREKIVPYVRAPEEVVPGKPRYFATNMPFGDSAFGLVVESHENRPTRIDGNEKHSSSLGATNLFAQAAVLNLYDPDRSQNPLQDGEKKTWIDFSAFWSVQKAKLADSKGEGLAVIAEPFSSPTMAAQVAEFRKKYPRAKWVTYQPVSDENIYAGIKLATGKDLRPEYEFGKARVILSLDSDFLQTESESVTSARGFAEGRRLESENDSMSRLYIVESNFTLTGGMADHRLRLQSRQIGAFALSLAFELKSQGVKINFLKGVSTVTPPAGSRWEKWLGPLAGDLIKNRGEGLLVAGRRQPAEVHALMYALNRALGNSTTQSLVEMKDVSASNTAELVDLVGRMQAGEVSTLVMLGGNPVYDAPADLKFSEALGKVNLRIRAGSWHDETSAGCNWHLPLSHFLESWGDVRSADGTIGPIQPLVAPLHQSRSDIEIIALLTGGSEEKGYDLVRKTWRGVIKGTDFEKGWNRVLHDGLLPDSEHSTKEPGLNNNNIAKTLEAYSNKAAEPSKGLEVIFSVSQTIFDGRFANNGWLQELPDPVSKISWDNAAIMSPATAKRLGLENKEIARLSFQGEEIEMPIWVIPGQADETVSLELGYGRKNAGGVGSDVGFDCYPLRRSDALYFGSGLSVVSAGRLHKIANTQDHSSMEGRPIVREAPLEEYRRHPHFAAEMVEHPPLKSMWDEHVYDEGYQWGMTIDLNTCIGCSACTVACQSENNIAVVGKDEVHEGREMHWIRIDRYFAGDGDDPEMVYQPVACQHCEDAPCEQVCPVAATNHDSEGLNTMIYNRCIGTRYCGNNCPYKVRRFNFFNYTKDIPELVKMAQNPDVTVRSRGVMEKCTYCTQRINGAKITAKKEGREVRDGEIVTACQKVCPTGAIEFGNILDMKSRVAKAKAGNRNYAMLSELNVKPRTTYLAKIRNPNPELD